MSTSSTGPDAGVGSCSSGFITTGAKMTPQAGVSLLKKLDQQRQEQNTKQAQHRTDGEVEVSDDEEDDISPVLVATLLGNNGSGGASGGSNGSPAPGGDGIGGPNVVGNPAPATNPNLIADDADAEAARNSLDLTEATIPKAIFTLARAGIAPPLTLFTPTALQRICSGQGTKSVKVTTELKDSAHLLDISLFPSEEKMDQAIWMTAYNTFPKFIQVAYGPETYLGFAKHFEAMISDSEFKDWFQAFRDFDIRIRSQFFMRALIINPAEDAYGKLL